MGKPKGLSVGVEEPEEPVVNPDDPKNQVSMGGSLHLAKGYAVTKSGVSHGKNKFLCLEPEDLEDLGNLGRGSSGMVRKVRHKKTDQILAVKQIKLGSDRHLGEIEKEISTLYGSKESSESSPSPYIIDFHGAYSLDLSVYIALEAMDGSLMDLIRPGQGVPEKVLACFTKAMLMGLQYLHKNRKLMHRDIKPQNLLYRKDGVCKITDFGVCSELDNTMAGTNSFVGTVTYMSPERLEGANYSFSADIWGLGVTIILMLTGEHPYDKFVGEVGTETKFWQLVTHLKEAPPPIPADGSDNFKDFIDQCLQRNPDQRPSAAELLEHPYITKNTGDAAKDREVIKNWIASLPDEKGGEEGGGGMSAAELEDALGDLNDF